MFILFIIFNRIKFFLVVRGIIILNFFFIIGYVIWWFLVLISKVYLFWYIWDVFLIDVEFWIWILLFFFDFKFFDVFEVGICSSFFGLVVFVLLLIIFFISIKG